MSLPPVTFVSVVAAEYVETVPVCVVMPLLNDAIPEAAEYSECCAETTERLSPPPPVLWLLVPM
eukprot:scaffold356259_cov96-Cyclotella_meneghiniana.AAC.4